MKLNESNNNINYESFFKDDLVSYLLSVDKVDKRLPDAPDIEERWETICRSYLPDGMKEFNSYPTVSLGWMMYIGMAVAKYWDEDWQLYGKVENIYSYLRDRIDFDHMDDYICKTVLGLTSDGHKSLQNIVAECASRTVNGLSHLNIEPGTKETFSAYVAALRQMYVMGAYMELKELGYHMTKL